MPKESDRHVGVRESIWFPLDEHQRMISAMREMMMTNKSDFIRSAVRSYLDTVEDELKQKGGAE